MKLIDILVGKKSSDDPKDQPSGVRITFEPSVRLLEEIDAMAKSVGCTREAAAASLAAVGQVSQNAVSSFFGAITESAKKYGPREDEADFRTQELRLTEATGKKDGLEQAAKACDAIASHRSGIPREVALQCASSIRDLKQKFIEEAMKRQIGRAHV
jgi:hypothetical protein